MAGYWAIGSASIASAPAMRVTMEMTAAKTGRLMKKCAMLTESRGLPAAVRDIQRADRFLGNGRFPRVDLRSGPRHLDAVHDHAFPGVESIHDGAKAPEEPPQFDGPRLDDVFFVHDEQEALVLVGVDDFFRNQQRL